MNPLQRWLDDYDLLIAPVSQVPPFPVEWRYPTSIDREQMHTYLDWMRSAYLISSTGLSGFWDYAMVSW